MRYTQISKYFFLAISVPFDFIPEFSEFSVGWFAFRKFNNFRFFWKSSKEISVPFVPVSKISKFWSTGKRPCLHRYRKILSFTPFAML